MTARASVDTAEAVVQFVAERERVPVAVLLGRARDAQTAYARQIAMTLMSDRLGLSSSHIGRIFHRDHSTVLHDVKVGRRIMPPSYVEAVSMLRLSAPPSPEQTALEAAVTRNGGRNPYEANP